MAIVEDRITTGIIATRTEAGTDRWEQVFSTIEGRIQGAFGTFLDRCLEDPDYARDSGRVGLRESMLATYSQKRSALLEGTEGADADATLASLKEDMRRETAIEVLGKGVDITFGDNRIIIKRNGSPENRRFSISVISTLTPEQFKEENGTVSLRIDTRFQKHASFSAKRFSNGEPRFLGTVRYYEQSATVRDRMISANGAKDKQFGSANEAEGLVELERALGIFETALTN